MSGWGGGRVGEPNFQLLMLSPNLLKSQIPMLGGGRGEGEGGWWNQLPTFDTEFKFAKIQNSRVQWGMGGGGGIGGPNFQLLMVSPNFPKKKKFSGKKVPGNGFGL